MSIRENEAYQAIVAELLEKFEARGRTVSRLLRENDRAGIAERAGRIRSVLRAQLDDPALCAAAHAAQRAGVLTLPEYTVEKLIVQGVQGLSIPVNLYLPRAGDPPFPAVIVPLGHWQEAKARADNQIFCANLAARGIAAVTYDPLFQGERCPYDPKDFPRLFGEASEDMWVVALHMRAGNLAYLLDRNIGALFVAEARAVLEYLCSRSDIDIRRIGAAGQSGGGTQSCYLAALDERISFYAPVQCVSRLAVTLKDGIGDCEQSLLRSSAAEGLEQCDLLWAAAPKPVLYSAALYDFFNAEGAKDAAREMAHVYHVLGADEKFRFRMANCGHEFTREAREHLYEWIGEQVGLPCSGGEIPITLQSAEALCCLPAGDKGRENPMRVYSLLLREAVHGRPSEPEKLRGALRRLIAAWSDGAPSVRPAGETVFEVSVHHGQWMRCELKVQPGAPLVFALDGQKTPLDTSVSILYSISWGNASAHGKQTRGYDAETCLFNASGVLGRNLASERARLILAAAEYAMDRCGVSRCAVVAAGTDTFPALLAACLDPRLSGPILCGGCLSQDDLFDAPEYFLRETEILPGLAALADLPALCRLCGAQLIDPRAADGCVYDAVQARRRFGVNAENTGGAAVRWDALIRRAIRKEGPYDDPD